MQGENTTHDEPNSQQSVTANQEMQQDSQNWAEHNCLLMNNVGNIMSTNPCSQGQTQIITI